MGFFSRWFKAEKTLSAADLLARLPGRWAGPGKIYTPAGVQNYRVELALAPENAGAAGKMVSYFESGTILDTPVQLKSEKEIWSLVYTQTNVHGKGKIVEGGLVFSQEDPTGKSGGETVEIWTFLSPEHLFIENLIIGPTGGREPFLKIMLQKS